MCGIVGYIGKGDAIAPVIEGLSRLEYRGYDSAGISLIEDSKIQTLKKEGKLENLKSALKKESHKSSIAIGHTRWATHGEVNDTNAHPHQNDTFAIVHNGIIENADKIKERLHSEFEYKSQTDSESFLNLLSFHFKELKDVKAAILKTFSEIEGNSAFVILHRETNILWSIKRSAPLVCGINVETRDLYISSDPYALVGFANKIFFPENEVLCECDPSRIENEIKFYELNGEESSRYKLQKKELSLNISEKGNYEHYMLKEIHEQPALIKNLIGYYFQGSGKSDLDKIEKKFDSVHIAACGTALHAGYLIKNYLEQVTKVPVHIDFASEFRYRNPLIKSNELGMFISQSGETADTLACQELCAENNLKTLSIVNVEGSTLFRDCDYNLLIQAGVEIGVASTKAFTQQVLVGLIMAKHLDGSLNRALSDELDLLAQKVDILLEDKEKIKSVAQSIYNKTGFIFTGRGDHYPIALEGALKLKEIAYVHAEGYAAGELKHGPISLIDENMVNIALVTPDLFDKTLSNAQEVKARKGIMVVVGQKDNKQIADIADYYIDLDYDGLTSTKPILSNVVLQLLSYYIAKLKGTDIDKPRNLAKSVTVE